MKNLLEQYYMNSFFITILFRNMFFKFHKEIFIDKEIKIEGFEGLK